MPLFIPYYRSTEREKAFDPLYQFCPGVRTQNGRGRQDFKELTIFLLLYIGTKKAQIASLTRNHFVEELVFSQGIMPLQVGTK